MGRETTERLAEEFLAELSSKRFNSAVSVSVKSVKILDVQLPLVAMVLGEIDVRPVILSTTAAITTTGNSFFMNLEHRRAFFDIERPICCQRSSGQRVSLTGTPKWVEDVQVSHLPTWENEVEIGLLNASPRSPMMLATGGFSIEIDTEGAYRNFVVSPEADSDLTYLKVVEEESFTVRARLVFGATSTVENENYIDLLLVLDTDAHQPATLYGGVLHEDASSSLEIAGTRFPLNQLSEGHRQVSAPRLSEPILVINPSVLHGATIHFDGRNNRVGVKVPNVGSKPSYGRAWGCIIA